MPRLIVPRSELKEILRERRRSGGDRYDEVWDGVYVMSPLANPDHQNLATMLSRAFLNALLPAMRCRVEAGTNVSDRDAGWSKNYRCPDVALFLPGGRAQRCAAHWMGGPDFVVEIISPSDLSREKFDFYARVGVRELLIVDRYPWKLELYYLTDGTFQMIGESSLERPDVLASAVIPLTMRLVAGEERPEIEVTRADGTERWLA